MVWAGASTSDVQAQQVASTIERASADDAGAGGVVRGAGRSGHQPAVRRTLTITFGGDVGLGGSDQPVSPEGAWRHGERIGWDGLTSDLAPLLTGDINFANLETVVTDRNDLSQIEKMFNFRSHPIGVRHLVKIGFNAFSTANNHAFDYGHRGIEETLRHLAGLKAEGLLGWPGVGLDGEGASRPADMLVKGIRVRLSALGIGGNGAASGGGRTAMMGYRSATDWRETVERLSGAEGDLKILSVHYGFEMQVRPGAFDIQRFRDEAVRGAGIDIVVGHHAHVAAGVQTIDGRLVLYGLGNLLHPGMQDMSAHGICRDYGLMVRVHLADDDTGRLRPMVVDAIALTGMHRRPAAMRADEGAVRMAVLNHLAQGLDDEAKSGAMGVRFTPQPDGSGRYCTPAAQAAPDDVARLCRGWTPPAPPAAALASRIARSCDGYDVARARGERRGQPVREVVQRAAASSVDLTRVWAER